MDFYAFSILAFVWTFFVIAFCGKNAGMQDKTAVLLGLDLAIGFDASYLLAHFFPSLPLVYLPPILTAALIGFWLAIRDGRRSASPVS